MGEKFEKLLKSIKWYAAGWKVGLVCLIEVLNIVKLFPQLHCQGSPGVNSENNESSIC